MNIISPNVKNLVRGSAIIYFDRDNNGYYRDLGNIVTFASSTPTQFVEHKTARSGAIILDRREPTEFSNMYKFGIDELNVKNLELLYNSSAATTLSQSSNTANMMTIATPVLDSAYDISDYQVAGLVAKKSGTVTLTAGTDYILEADLGMISFPATGSVMSSDTISLTFTNPAVAGDIVMPLSKNAAISGACKAYFRTSDGRLWLRSHTLVQLAFDGDTAFSGAEFAKAEGQLLFMPDYSHADYPFGKLTLIPAAA